MMDIKDRLIEKSKEAFIMAIEVYNKPTIKYRVEGFSFFICNAWELMLKAHMINISGNSSIYYKDHPDRTLSLENCVSKVFTNDKDPLRRNLGKIIELRNISTHFITEEYEMVYIPLFQSAVFNYSDKMQEFHNVDMTEIIPQNFLALAVSYNSFNDDVIIAKYPSEIANKLIGINASLSPIVDENNDRFAIRIIHDYYFTKDESKATALVKVDKNADQTVKIIKELKDPNDIYKFTCKKCCSEVNKRLDKQGIEMKVNGEKHIFNRTDFNLFCKYYSIKENTKLCYI